MIQLEQESEKKQEKEGQNMNFTSHGIKKFSLDKKFSEDQDEEGFIEDKEPYSYIEIPSNNLKLKELIDQNDGDESDDEQDYKSIRHRFSLHLPEANPLLDTSKQVNYEPKLLLQNIVIVKQPVDQQTSSSRISSNQIQPGQYQFKQQRQQDEQVQDVYLYDKYMNNAQYYNLVYSKYSENRQESDMLHNFAGYYLNLASVFSLGKHISNQIYDENDIFLQLKEKHQYKSITSSPLSNSINKKLDLNEIDQQKCMSYLSDGEDQIIIEDIKDTLNVSENKQLVFDSRFESGNLMYAFQRNDPKYTDEYDLIICNDINSKGYAQWFYFSISNTRKNQTIKLNLVNHSKKQSLFKNGMKPAIFSVKKNKNEKEKNWERGGNNIKYYQNKILKEESHENYYYTLSFTYTFEFDDDVVYFAMSYPYSYTQMINHLNRVIEKCTTSFPNMHIKKEILCHTISNNAVPLLTITNKESEQQDKNKQQTPIHESKNKKIAMLLARQHPGETVSSFLMQGVIDFLVSDTVEANTLRSKYIFKIIPMVNPDGVLYGNFRCNLSGVDLNRQWSNPNKHLHPSVYNIKKLIMKYRQLDYQIDYFIDLHGHSKKLNSFIYACKMESDQYACCVFPMMLSKLNTILHYPSCTFGLESYKVNNSPSFYFNNILRKLKKNSTNNNNFMNFKENTARGIAWSSGVNKPNIFTIETSFFGYNDKQNGGKATHFKIQDLFKLGGDIIKCMFAYYIENNADEATKQQLALTLKAYTIFRKSTVIQEIIKSNAQQISSEINLQQDSGSDSDPLADELTVKEKINNVIGIKIAKSIGLVNQQIINSGNASGQERCKQHCSLNQPKRKTSASTNSTGPSSRIKQNNQVKDGKQIQIENQAIKSIQKRKYSGNTIQNSCEFKNISNGNTVPIQSQDQCLEKQLYDTSQNEQFCFTNQSQTLPPDSPIQNFQHSQDAVEEESQQREKRYQVKIRNFEKELIREQEIKREKEEIYKRRFRIQKNTPLNTPKSYNILIDPKTVLKYKSSNIAAFLKTGQLANNYYGNNEDNDIEGSLDNSKDQIHKEPRKEDILIEGSLSVPKNRFHAQNGLKGINTFRQGNQQYSEGETNQNQISRMNPLQICSGNYTQQGQIQMEQPNERSIKSARSGRLYSAINRLAQQTQTDTQSSMLIQNQRNQPTSIDNKKSSTQNAFYTSRKNDQTYEDNINNSQQQQYYNSDSQQIIKRSSSGLKGLNQQNSDTKSNNLIKNFSKILQENSKKYNCDTKILHLSRNTTSSCSTQRKPSNKLSTLQAANQVSSQINENKGFSKQSASIESSQSKEKNNQTSQNNQIFSTELQMINAQQYSINQQEQTPQQNMPLQLKSQNQHSTGGAGRTKYNVQSNQNSFLDNQTPSNTHYRSGTGSSNSQRTSYFRKFKINFQKNQNLVNQTVQYQQFKNKSLNNKILALKQLGSQLKEEVNHIINNSQQNFLQQYDPNNSEILLNSWNPEISHKKLVGLTQQRFYMESKTTYQTPKHSSSQEKNIFNNTSYFHSLEHSSRKSQAKRLDGIIPF